MWDGNYFIGIPGASVWPLHEQRILHWISQSDEECCGLPDIVQLQFPTSFRQSICWDDVSWIFITLRGPPNRHLCSHPARQFLHSYGLALNGGPFSVIQSYCIFNGFATQSVNLINMDYCETQWCIYMCRRWNLGQ